MSQVMLSFWQREKCVPRSPFICSSYKPSLQCLNNHIAKDHTEIHTRYHSANTTVIKLQLPAGWESAPLQCTAPQAAGGREKRTGQHSCPNPTPPMNWDPVIFKVCTKKARHTKEGQDVNPWLGFQTPSVMKEVSSWGGEASEMGTSCEIQIWFWISFSLKLSAIWLEVSSESPVDYLSDASWQVEGLCPGSVTPALTYFNPPCNSQWYVLWKPCCGAGPQFGS